VQTGGLGGRGGAAEEAEAENGIGGESARIGARTRRRSRGAKGASPELRRVAPPARVAGTGWRIMVRVTALPFWTFRVLFCRWAFMVARNWN
jgi:hypothetical protein